MVLESTLLISSLQLGLSGRGGNLHIAVSVARFSQHVLMVWSRRTPKMS